MVNSTSVNTINSNNSFSTPFNNALYQNFVTILKKGVYDKTNTIPNNKVNTKSKKYVITDNQADFISQSDINIIKNSKSNKNINSTISSPHISPVKQHSKKYNNRRLNFDILTRIFIFTENPKAFSLVCHQWYYISKETSSKLLWFVNR